MNDVAAAIAFQLGCVEGYRLSKCFMTLRPISDDSIRPLPKTQQLALSEAMFSDPVPRASVDYGDEWTDGDLREFSARSLFPTDVADEKCTKREATMGYDFMFFSLPPIETDKFPLSIENAPPSTGALPWAAFRDWLISIGGQTNGEENCIWVEYGEHGSIWFTGDDKSIFLDVHAHWEHVVAAYRKLKSLDPHACVFDPQPGLFHDERSFVEFTSPSKGKL